MSSGKRLPLRQAKSLADKVVATLDPACYRIEVAGSVRRGKATVGDLEVVCIPARGFGLFPHQAGPSRLDALLDQLLREGRLQRPAKPCNGERQKRFIVSSCGVQLDLFITDAVRWGVTLALRTGPQAFSRSLVVPRRRPGGRLQDGLTVHDSQVWHDTDVIRGMVDGRDYTGPFVSLRGGAEPAVATPEEADFLALAGGWIPPELRDAEVGGSGEPRRREEREAKRRSA